MIDFLSSKLLMRHLTFTQIFDVFQNQELVSFTEYLMRVHESLIDVANEILDTALQRVRLSFFLKPLQCCAVLSTCRSTVQYLYNLFNDCKRSFIRVE